MTMTSNEKLDFQSDEMAFTIEPLNPNLDKAIKYVRANIEKIRSFKIRGVIVFDDLRVVQRALANLDENLMRKPDAGADVVNAIAPHAMLLSGEDPSISSAVTHITVEIMQKLLGEKELHNYWLESLKVDSNLQRSLNKAAGVYSLDVEADHPTTTSGGAEIQQALVASLLHRSYATISMGNTRLDKKLDNHKHKKRTKEIELHRNLLTNAKSKLLSFQKKPHLSEIIEPVTSKVNLFSHNQDLIIDPDGSFNLRECMDPLKEKVRLYRSGDKGKSVLFCDITVEQCLNLDPKLLGKILSSKDETIPGMGLEEKWYKVQDGYNIDKVAVKPTPYSISSRIFESKQLQTMRAIEGGNYVSHISFDYGKIFLKKNHVAENGASAKLEAWGIAQAIQHERKAGEKLFKGSTPKSEIFPNYDDIELPDIKTTKKLIGIIEKMRDENEDFNNLYDNEDAIKFLKSLGMQNVRIRFEDIMPEQSANLIGILNQLNAKYVFSKRKILTEFLNQNNNLTGIPSDEVQQEILNFLIPEITLQDIMAIGMSHADGGIVATNELQFLKSNELAHKAQPLIENKNGKLNVDSNKFITQLQLEKTLSSLGCNTYNIYKILSSDWRHGPAGAEI